MADSSAAPATPRSITACPAVVAASFPSVFPAAIADSLNVFLTTSLLTSFAATVAPVPRPLAIAPQP
ncbi:MAG: hypothetical protein AAB425_13595, partial [Bdellovibrionota bacterium]